MALVKVQEVIKVTSPAGQPGAISITTTAGNLLILVANLRTGGSQSVTGVVDSAGNTWARCTDGVTNAIGFHSGTDGRIEIWSTPNAAAVTTVTPTISTNLLNTMTVIEVSGAATSSHIEDVGVSDNNATTSPSAGSAVTSVTADCFIVGAISNRSYTGAYTDPGAPWDNFQFTPEVGTGSSSLRGRGVTRIVASTGTYTATWGTASAVTGGGAIVAFRASATTPQTMSPSPVAVPAVVPSPSVALGALTIGPTPQTVPLAVPAPTVALGALTLSPSPVAVPLATPAPSVSLGALTVSPSPVAVPLALPTPTVATPLALAPSPVAVPLALPAPAVSLGALAVSPSPVAVPLAVPAPAVTHGAITVAPDPVTIPIATPAPAVSLGAVTVSPDPVVVPLALPAPTITAPSNQTLAPDPVAVPVAVPAPAVTVEQPLTPIIVSGPRGAPPSWHVTRPSQVRREVLARLTLITPDPVVCDLTTLRLEREEEELMLAGVL